LTKGYVGKVGDSLKEGVLAVCCRSGMLGQFGKFIVQILVNPIEFCVNNRDNVVLDGVPEVAPFLGCAEVSVVKEAVQLALCEFCNILCRPDDGY